MSDPNLAPAAPAAALPFKNDGSFLEHFLKMSQGGQDAQASASSSTSGGDVKPANGQPEPTSKAAEAEGADKVMKDEKQQGSADEARPETPDAAEADHSSEGETKKPKPGPFAKFAKKGPFAGAAKRGATSSGDASAAAKKKKTKKDSVEGAETNPAWEAYLREVEKYKSASCAEERENRPLVK